MGRRSDPAPFFVFGQMKGPGAVRRARGGGGWGMKGTHIRTSSPESWQNRRDGVVRREAALEIPSSLDDKGILTHVS